MILEAVQNTKETAKGRKWKIGIIESNRQSHQEIKSAAKTNPLVGQIKIWSSAEEFWQYSLKDSLDLLLLDIRLPGWDGVRVTQEIQKKNPNLPILIMTTVDDEQTVFDCLKAGASGYMLKMNLERLPEMLEDVMNGGCALSPKIALKVIGHFHKAATPKSETNLTKQEINVLQLVVLGKTRKIIADSLSVSLSTVKFHIQNIYKKLNVNNMAALTQQAHQLNLI